MKFPDPYGLLIIFDVENLDFTSTWTGTVLMPCIGTVDCDRWNDTGTCKYGLVHYRYAMTVLVPSIRYCLNRGKIISASASATPQTADPERKRDDASPTRQHTIDSFLL